jgi:cysteine-rich repeat protein
MVNVSRALVIVLLLATGAHAQPQTGAQQRCINSFNKAALRLASAHADSFNACVLEAFLKMRHIETCYGFDPDGKIAAAQAKLAQVESTRCTDTPDFGQGALAAATGTASAESIALLRQLHLVLPPELEESRAACVRVADDRAQRLLQAKLKAFGKCKKAGLAAGTVISPATLSSCLDAAKASADAKIAKLVAAGEKSLSKSCPFPLYLQGCADQTPGGAAACVDRITDCRACKFVTGVDGASPDCDTFDDGIANGSCPDACGNGVVGAGLNEWEPEACDDANLVSDDGCDSNCTPSGCGNGVLTAGEFCDRRTSRCQGGDDDGESCERNEQCAGGLCTSCPPGGCSNDCTGCGAGICCDTRFGCLIAYDEQEGCAPVAGTPVACDGATCQHSGTCCKNIFLDWQSCHSAQYVMDNCINWGGHYEPCSECLPCCAFSGYCTSWDAIDCLEYEGTPVDCAQCWGP